MKKYISIFAVTYLLAILACLFAAQMFGINSSANMFTLVGAALVASFWFVKDEQRAPDADEKSALVWGSLFSAIAVSAVLVSAYLYSTPDRAVIIAELQKVSGTIWAVAAGVIVAVYLALLSLCYGWVARKFAGH